MLRRASFTSVLVALSVLVAGAPSEARVPLRAPRGPIQLREGAFIRLRQTRARPGALAPRKPARKVVLNLGGEGELQVAGAVVYDINLLDAERGGYVIRKGFVREARNPIVQADMTRLPFRDGTADEVVGNRVPFHVDFAPRVVNEAFRVLKPGARVKLFSITGGAEGWRRFLDQAGFADLHVEGAHMVGTRP